MPDYSRMVYWYGNLKYAFEKQDTVTFYKNHLLFKSIDAQSNINNTASFPYSGTTKMHIVGNWTGRPGMMPRIYFRVQSTPSVLRPSETYFSSFSPTTYAEIVSDDFTVDQANMIFQTNIAYTSDVVLYAVWLE